MAQNSYDVVAQRVKEVVYYLINGLSTDDIYKIAETKDWGVTQRTVRYYIQRARKIIIQRTYKNIDYYIARGIRRYDNLYMRLYQAGDYKGAALMQEKLEKLLSIGNNKPSDNNNLEPLDYNKIDKIVYANYLDTSNN